MMMLTIFDPVTHTTILSDLVNINSNAQIQLNSSSSILMVYNNDHFVEMDFDSANTAYIDVMSLESTNKTSIHEFKSFEWQCS